MTTMLAAHPKIQELPPDILNLEQRPRPNGPYPSNPPPDILTLEHKPRPAGSYPSNPPPDIMCPSPFPILDDLACRPKPAGPRPAPPPNTPSSNDEDVAVEKYDEEGKDVAFPEQNKLTRRPKPAEPRPAPPPNTPSSNDEDVKVEMYDEGKDVDGRINPKPGPDPGPTKPEPKPPLEATQEDVEVLTVPAWGKPKADPFPEGPVGPGKSREVIAGV